MGVLAAAVGGGPSPWTLALVFAAAWASAFLVSVVCRLVTGGSLTYVVRLLVLEIRVGMSHNSSAPKVRAKPGSLTQEQKSLPVRGIHMVDQAALTRRGQTFPPKRAVGVTFGKETFPPGERVENRVVTSSGWPWESNRTRSRPKTPADEGSDGGEDLEHRLRCLREAAEVHRQTRQSLQRVIRPGMELKAVFDFVETAANALLGLDAANPLKRGLAFPVGLSLNEVAAHDTVNPGDLARWLLPQDLLKVDIGVHVDGYIIDSAFSVAFDPMHDELMRTVQEAVDLAIRLGGPDVLVSEIGGQVQELIESAEVHRPDGKVLPIYSVKNLTGHTLGRYKIHAGKSLPATNSGGRVRMLADEQWAVEIFASAGGNGYARGRGASSHFMRPNTRGLNRMEAKVMTPPMKELLDLITRKFGTLAFCPRWVVQHAQSTKSSLAKGGAETLAWRKPLDALCGLGLVSSYPPLCDVDGSYVAQYEHTMLVSESGKEVLTRGADF